jgi:hypothetical protein
MNQILSSRTPVERSKRIKNDSEEECFWGRKGDDDEKKDQEMRGAIII